MSATKILTTFHNLHFIVDQTFIYNNKKTKTTAPFYGHYTDQTALAGTSN